MAKSKKKRKAEKRKKLQNRRLVKKVSHGKTSSLRVSQSTTLSPKVSQRTTFSIENKLRKIDASLRDFGRIFGYYSKEYQNVENLVLTHIGVSHKSFSSKKPLQITPEILSMTIKMGVTSSPVIDSIYDALPSVFDKIKEKYGEGILTEYNLNKSANNKQKSFTLKFYNENKKFVEQYVNARSFLSSLEQDISYMPNYYSALDNMDTDLQIELKQKFAKMGHLHIKDEAESELIAQELRDRISAYYQARVNNDTLIISADRLNEDELEGDNIVDRLLMHRPLSIFSDIEDPSDLTRFLKK